MSGTGLPGPLAQLDGVATTHVLKRGMRRNLMTLKRIIEASRAAWCARVELPDGVLSRRSVWIVVAPSGRSGASPNGPSGPSRRASALRLARRVERRVSQDAPVLRRDKEGGPSDVREADPGHPGSESSVFAWRSAQSSA